MSAPQLPSEEIRKQLVDLEFESEQKVGRIVSLTTRLEELKSKLHTANIERGALQSSIAEAQADIDHLHEDITRIQDYVALISLHLFLFCFFAFFLFFFLRTTNPFSTQGKFPNRKEPLFRSRVFLYRSCCLQGLRGEPLILLPRLHALHPTRAIPPRWTRCNLRDRHLPQEQLRRHPGITKPRNNRSRASSTNKKRVRCNNGSMRKHRECTEGTGKTREP